MTTPAATAAKPAFSFAGLSIEDATVPKQRREGAAKDNPFADVMLESYRLAGDAGKRITVPAANVGEAIYLLRDAAAKLELGSRIVLQDRNGNPLSMGSKGGKTIVKDGKARKVGAKSCVVKEDGNEFTGNVVIIFKAKDKKARTTADAANNAGS